MLHRDGKRKWRKIQLRYASKTAARLLAEGANTPKELDFWFDQKEKDGRPLVLSAKKAKKFLRAWNQIMFFGAIARAVRPEVPESRYEKEEA